ncbi:hypothetical protein QBC37DRAFT_373397 [Rhypophila decipiens]|uniref:Ubiquitin-like protease family profile domain-containing protein n=1 Tax=Rhypophila decipiens TaxID=261697 RepID=A0AAN6Y9T5_9PEZI|nr:hypothetical protein QBC37DRAFT_373397 [Rhypophila decipiens]
MAPRAPTPRTTRNSRGLRATTTEPPRSSVRADPLDRHPVEENPPPATPAPSGPSPIAALGRRSISPIYSAPPSPLSLSHFAQVTAHPSLSPLPEAQVTAPPQIIITPATPRGTVSSLPVIPVKKASPPIGLAKRETTGKSLAFKLRLERARFLRRLTSRDTGSRVCKETRKRRGANFARELFTADKNDRFMTDCTCSSPVVYDTKEAAANGAGRLRFFEDSDGKLDVLYRKHDPSFKCKCGRKLLPIYGNLLTEPVGKAPGLLNQNGKRPAEDSEVDLLAQTTGEFERVIPSLSERAPRHQSALRLQTLKRRSMSYLTQLKHRLQNMGNSFFTFLGRPFSQQSGRDHSVVERRHVDPEHKSVVAKRYKRQHCIPVTGNDGPAVEPSELPHLEWRKDPLEWIGQSMVDDILREFARHSETIKGGGVATGLTAADVRSNIQPGQDLELSLWFHDFFLQVQGNGILNEPRHRQELAYAETTRKYLVGLQSIHKFMETIYSPEEFDKIRTLYPTPKTPFIYSPEEFDKIRTESPTPEAPFRPLGDIWFRNQCQQTAKFLNWFLQSNRQLSAPLQEAISKIIMDANALHKQELPLSYAAHTGRLIHPDMPELHGRFPTPVLDEIPVDEITIDHDYDLKYPDSQAKSKPSQRAVLKPKSILKDLYFPDPLSSQRVSAPEKRRKLPFESPTATYLPPHHIPRTQQNSIQVELEREKRQAECEVATTLNEGKTPLPGRVDLHVVTTTHERLGLPTPSNYACAELGGKKNAQEDDERLKLRFHASEYKDLLDEMRREDGKPKRRFPDPPRAMDVDDTFPENPERIQIQLPLVAPTIRTLYGPLSAAEESRFDHRHKKESNELDWIIPGERLEQNIEPEVPRLSASLKKPTKKLVTSEDRKKAIDRFLDEDDSFKVSASPLAQALEISTQKLDELDINRQIREEFAEALARQVKEREQREIQRKAEEERKRREEERRRVEEERRRAEEERRRVADARRRKEAAQYAQLTGLRPPARSMITPLTSEWNERVTRASQANPNAELTTTPDGNPLRRQDFAERLLPPTAWLNDNIIIGSILYVAQYINDSAGVNSKQNPKCAAMTSYFWPRLQQHGLNSCARLMRLAGIRKENFLDIDTILVPICEHSHWTLGVVCPSRRTVSHIDSMRAGGSHQVVVDRLLDWVKATLGDAFVEADWNKITYRTPLQTNGYDCGVFTITNAICLALGVDPKESYSERELTLQRRRLAAILLNGGFKGDLTLAGL